MLYLFIRRISEWTLQKKSHQVSLFLSFSKTKFSTRFFWSNRFEKQNTRRNKRCSSPKSVTPFPRPVFWPLNLASGVAPRWGWIWGMGILSNSVMPSIDFEGPGLGLCYTCIHGVLQTSVNPSKRDRKERERGREMDGGPWLKQDLLLRRVGQITGGKIGNNRSTVRNNSWEFVRIWIINRGEFPFPESRGKFGIFNGFKVEKKRSSFSLYQHR